MKKLDRNHIAPRYWARRLLHLDKVYRVVFKAFQSNRLKEGKFKGWAIAGEFHETIRRELGLKSVRSVRYLLRRGFVYETKLKLTRYGAISLYRSVYPKHCGNCGCPWVRE